MQLILSERNQTQKAAHCTIHMTFWKRQNWGDKKHVSGCQRLRLRESLLKKGWEGVLEADRIILFLVCNGDYDCMSLPQFMELCTEKGTFYCM